MKQPKVRSVGLIYLFLFAGLIFLAYLIMRTPPAAKPADIYISQVVTMSQANQIKSLNVQGQNISIVGTDGTKYTSFLPDNVNIYQVTLYWSTVVMTEWYSEYSWSSRRSSLPVFTRSGYSCSGSPNSFSPPL